MKIKTVKINDINISKYNPRKDLNVDDEEYKKIKSSWKKKKT